MTFLHKFKCLFCQLHFIVCSWSKDYPMTGEKAKKLDQKVYEDHHEDHHAEWRKAGLVHCPECGQTDRDAFLHWVEETNDPIFSIVPGKAQGVD